MEAEATGVSENELNRERHLVSAAHREPVHLCGKGSGRASFCLVSASR